MEADLSAQMAFRYLRRRPPTSTATPMVVTNNHFDQDGLVGVLALVDPDGALAARGACSRTWPRPATSPPTAIREAARLLDDAGRLGGSPAHAASRCRRTTRIGSPPSTRRRSGACRSLADHPERFRDLWDREDAALTASEKLLASGRIEIDERPELHLAIVDVPDDVELYGGHRFAHEWVSGLHPMALYDSATVPASPSSCARVGGTS